MSLNLTELYSFIRKTYPDCNVLYNDQLSYLEAIGEKSTKTIFICKEDLTRLNTYIHNYIPQNDELDKNHSKNLDLTGSPLKDTCEIDTLDLSLEKFTSNPWNDYELAYTAISVKKGRNILCDYEFQKIGNGCVGSTWILCDATDNEKTILLNMDFAPGLNSRGIVYYKGCLPTSKLNSAEMIKIHSSQIHGVQKIETSIDCFFNIKPNVTLKLNWNSSSLNPALSNYNSSEVMLNQTIKVGESGSVAEDFWRQLQILSKIKDAILDYKNEDGFQEPVYRCGSGIDLEDLREKVITTMTDLPGFYDLRSIVGGTEIEAIIQKVKTRKPLDVTDKLWEILKRCSSYKDLKLAFQYVFQCAATYNIVNIPNNQNRLAEIIREVSQRRLAMPCLVGTEPMELLLEIGIEKILKDYESIFIESKICGKHDLKAYMGANNIKVNNELEKSSLNIRKSLYNAVPNEGTQRKTILLKTNIEEVPSDIELVGFQNSKFNQKEIENVLARLAQTHLALEHLLLIQIHLNLDNVYNQILKDLMQSPPKPFDKVVNGVYDNIEIPIMTDKILHHLESKDPHARRIVMSSKNKFNEVRSTFYYSMDNIFPPNTFEGIPSSDDKEMAKESMYHHWYYVKITTKRC